MMCVARSLGKKTLTSPGGTLIITPDGPLYKNPDTSEYVHHLDREAITVNTPPKAEQKKVSFEDLFGIESVKTLLEPVILFYKRPELAAKWRVRRPGNVLLFGPEGTGKTAVGHALANEIGADLQEISPADIYGRWMGDSERAIQDIFNKVRDAKKPTILLFDEMEGIISVANSNGDGSRTTNAVAGIFKTESARVTEENPNVILVATTNDPARLDPALIRAGRFDLQIAMERPNNQARMQIFANLILNYHDIDADQLLPKRKKADNDSPDNFKLFDSNLLSEKSLAELVQLTAIDFSITDIIESLRRAAISKAYQEDQTGQEPSPIDLAFLTKVITGMRQGRA